ncbi:MAG: hypothetical protein H6510_09980 [Acidobacteria bacterium]|nr:hypothetical protein [Acidobacteriota bacterium]MCB9398136.1 hypothetical protein [Acidobacteriota bacterium]
MLKTIWILGALMLLGCATNQGPWIPKKDETGFKLPAEIVAIAPEMQSDIFALMRYASAYFPVKPEFVFREQDNSFIGNLQPFVQRLHLIHLVGYQDKKHQWSASLLFDPERGAAVNSVHGWSLDIVPGPTQFEVIFQSATKIQFSLPIGRDDARWETLEGDRRVFFYYYRFPERISDQGSTPGGKN